MAATLQAAKRFLIAGNLTPTLSRSAFIARKRDYSKPDWVNVGLALGATVGIWVLLIKQHNEDVAEYERRKAERGL